MDGLCGCRFTEDVAICEEGAGEGRQCSGAELRV